MGDLDFDSLLARLAATPAQLKKADLTAARARFAIIRELGSGAFGDVYEARDRQSGAVVALKALKSSEADWLLRFKREFRSVADISHPNVVRLYELFNAGEQWFLTMELVNGLPLDEHVARVPGQLSSCFAQLASAIAALHEADCVHCDIKPSNILVEQSGRVVLLDFGMARQQSDPHLSAIGGTPHYMAPECGMGDPPTKASDWYAFGVMLHEALTGERAFVGTDQELASLKLAGPPPCEPKAFPDAPTELTELATELLSPVSIDRPSASRVIATLSKYVASEPPSSAVDLVDSARFVGRAPELETLGAALDQSRNGLVLATVSGTAGIGKSALLGTFADSARARGAVVCDGRCHAGEGVAYTGLDGAIDVLCSELRRRPDAAGSALTRDEATALCVMFPVLRRLPAFARIRDRHATGLAPWELRRHATSGLMRLLEGLADLGPVVLFIDDFHWASTDTADLLLEVVGHADVRVLVVVAFNSEARGRAAILDDWLDEVEARGTVSRHLELEPLERHEIAELLCANGDDASGLEPMIHATGGDPYLIVRALAADLDGDPDASDLVRAFLAQLDALPHEARRLLELVSVCRVPLPQDTACMASGMRSWSPETVDRLRRAKLVRTLGNTRESTIEPYHERVRSTTLDAMSDGDLARMHFRLARYLEQYARVAPVILAHHYRCGRAKDQARRWAERAASEAKSALAFARGAQLYRDATELAESNEDRIALLVELAEALEQSGRRADAGRACLEAAELAEAEPGRFGAPWLRSRAGEHLILAGHFSEGIELVSAALAEVNVELPTTAARAVAETINMTAELATRGLEFEPREEAELELMVLRRVDLELSTARALVFTDVRAPWISTRALVDALDAGEPVRVQRALCHFAFANVARAPDHELVEVAIDKASQLAESSRDDVGLAFACLARGMLHVQRMEHHAAVRVLREATHRFATSGRQMSREVAISRVLTGMVCGNYGVDLAMAQTIRARCTADAREREDMFILNWVRLLGTWLDLSTGDADAAARSLAEARAAWPNVEDDFFVATSLMHEVSIELYARPETVWESVQELEVRFHRLFTSLVPVPRAMFYRHWGFAAVLAYQQGNASRADTLARLEQSAKVIGALPYIRSLQGVIRAHIAAVHGDVETAAAELDAAAETWYDTGQRGPAMLTELRRFQLLGDDSEAMNMHQRLRSFGAGNPDAYARLFVGPRLDATVSRAQDG